MSTKSSILVTGGAGFIGSNFVLHWMSSSKDRLVNLDALTYASNIANLVSLKGNPEYTFVKGDIRDAGLVAKLLSENRPRAIIHFAAESHVDRSIVGPETFVETNVDGTFRLLEAARAYLATLSEDERNRFRFVHVSTDEVYGTLGPGDSAFSEKTPYAPNSPYAASKAASDFFARAWFHTYNLPVLITNCSNNYGPYQHPEKLIPLMISHALTGKPLPIYGDGLQVRDWLFVEDHCKAIVDVVDKGVVGQTYNIGGDNQRSNREVVQTICALLDELVPDSPFRPHAQLVTYVTDRPGHDRRYAIDASKIERDLAWRPLESFETGLRKTIKWYLANDQWIATATGTAFQEWLARNYDNRIEQARTR
jgi:dTDP-glucose 4,6-dehydratase